MMSVVGGYVAQTYFRIPTTNELSDLSRIPKQCLLCGEDLDQSIPNSIREHAISPYVTTIPSDFDRSQCPLVVHRFHAECINQWLFEQHQPSCPSCHTSVVSFDLAVDVALKRITIEEDLLKARQTLDAVVLAAKRKFRELHFQTEKEVSQKRAEIAGVARRALRIVEIGRNEPQKELMREDLVDAIVLKAKEQDPKIIQKRLVDQTIKKAAVIGISILGVITQLSQAILKSNEK